MAQTVAVWETWVGKIPGEGKPTTPVFLPGESPRTEEPGGLQSMGVAESDTTERLAHSQVFLQLYSSFLFISE